MTDIAYSTNIAHWTSVDTIIASVFAIGFAFDSFVFARLSDTTSSDHTASISPPSSPHHY
jgi:hypothetical protein